METPRKAVEQNLAEIAFASVAEKSPSLMDYYLGFDLVEKNDAGTKAAGIMGFQIGSELIYIPILFLNGKVKGTDVMYLKNSDVFTVNDEKEINLIIAKTVDGKPAPEQDMHAATDTGEVSKAMALFGEPPASATKNASWEETRFQDFDDLVHDKGPMTTSLPNFLARAGKDFFQKAASVLAIPEIWEQVVKYYDPKELMVYKIEEKVAQVSPNTNTIKTPYAVTIEKALELEKQAGKTLFSQEDKKSLFSNGYIIKNAAEGEKASKVKISNREGDRSFIQTAGSTGIYNVIDINGKSQKAAIVFADKDSSRPICSGGSQARDIFLIDSDGVMRSMSSDAKIYTTDDASLVDSEKNDFKKFLPSSTSLSSPKSVSHSEALLVAPDGKEAMSIYIGHTIKSGNKLFYSNGYGSHESSIYIVDRKEIGKTTGIKKDGNNLFVPSDYHILVENESSCSSPVSDREDRKVCKVIPAASISSIHSLLSKHGAEDIRIKKAAYGNDIRVSMGGKTVVVDNRCDTVLHLVKEASLSLTSAEKIASEIFDNHQYQVEAQFIRAKVAENPVVDPTTQTGMTPSGVPIESPASTNTELVNRAPVDAQDPNDPTQGTWATPSSEDIDLISRAADSESREVFDPAMIGTIVRTTRAMNMVEDFLPEFVDNMDRMIRLLLLFYWHNSEFADSYGIDQMADFEDLLLTTIRSTSKTILFLKQKVNKDENTIDVL